MLPSRHTEVRMTRAELEGMIRPALDETVVALRRALTSAGVAPPEVAAVLLVGGSSRIPLVAQLVGAALARPIAVDARPKDAIALGAALAAMTAAGARPPLPPPPVVRPTPIAAPIATPAATPLPPPPGGPPLARSPGGSGHRALLGAVAGIVVAGLVAAVVLSSRGGDPEAGGQEPASTSAPATTSPTTGRSGTSAPGTSASGDPGSGPFIPSPLPGDDWSDAGRAQFMADCTTGVAPAMGVSGAGADDMCTCMYDDISTSTDFAGFNEQWTSHDFDPSSPAGQAITSATLGCAAAG
jgi:hypothetical protein